ncbi:ATP-binding region ATPase domain protein [Natrinema pellirubrum DSM 15624]|uniref:histidine kinase n=1 Tax=Natrinema pellirubrum (strain DSM 15624 / CIP 106293 / JCM 10476 / NCIMB 786 / 157) TaxID=797303 RepID=L0JPC8_NATP1|nr:ATP-binding protein [Natrinema pellirubrum]AGB33370.1 signal transduction histidine kinase [Natrinema pellirubrum DSM 15624]ELY71198.1 ATP-binding region ATPase domain protein [Natrinema pellirubrum DSM 15624]
MSHDTPASSQLVGTPLWLERSSLPWLVTAFGGLSIAGLVGWWLAFADTIGATAYLTTLLSIGVPAVGLSWGGYRLTESDIDESRYGRVCKWCFGGAVAFLAVNMLSIVFFPADSVAGNTTWAHFAINTGAVGGFAVGYVEARAIQREVEATAATVRARQLEDERELLAYLNDLLRHEVLNSSQIIGGHATLLQAECDREAVRDRLETIERESDNLVGVIEDVRAMLDANRGPQSESAVDLVAVLESQLLEYRTRFDDVDIEADLPETAHVSANEGVKWIFANLLENAIEHNEGEARVRVTAERGPETVVVRVADNGPGIAEADRETLFERRSTNHGLGLYLSRILASRYGGDVELVETGPNGSVFAVTLQRAASTDADVDAAERSQ